MVNCSKTTAKTDSRRLIHPIVAFHGVSTRYLQSAFLHSHMFVPLILANGLGIILPPSDGCLLDKRRRPGFLFYHLVSNQQHFAFRHRSSQMIREYAWNIGATWDPGQVPGRWTFFFFEYGWEPGRGWGARVRYGLKGFGSRNSRSSGGRERKCFDALKRPG